MSVEILLSRLERVHRKREGQWVACCPSHLDKSPSLAIGTGKDGRVLLNCFGGCSALDVISAVGMEWDDLFPEKRDNYRSLMEHMKRKPTVDDAVVSFANHDTRNGNRLSAADKARLKQAIARGGRDDGTVAEVVVEVLMGENEQLLQQLEGR